MSARATLAAPAKVNLLLRVLGKRPDGYHDIETLFQAIDLADEVAVELRERGIELEVRGADLGPVEDNLAYRAAARLANEARLDVGVRVELAKRIPVGAGLGGGSSDAAAVLTCAGALVGIPRADARLRRIAEELGSDVPFFLGESPLARGTGRGEILEPLEPLPSADLVIVSPPVHVSTAAAYGALADARLARGDTAASAAALDGGGRSGPRGGASRHAQPRAWSEVAAMAANDFEPVVACLHPEISRACAALAEAGASLVMMSGSGSTSFGLFADGDAAVRAAAQLEWELAWPCRAVRTLASLPSPVVG